MKITLNFDNKIDLLRKSVDIYSAIGVDETSWLAPREREYFVHCILLYNQNIPIASKEGVEYLTKTLNFSKKDRGVYIYRKALINKGWLQRVDKRNYEIVPVFKRELTKFNIQLNELGGKTRSSNTGIFS